MSIITSRLDTRSEAFRDNAGRTGGLVEELRAKGFDLRLAFEDDPRNASGANQARLADIMRLTAVADD